MNAVDDFLKALDELSRVREASKRDYRITQDDADILMSSLDQTGWLCSTFEAGSDLLRALVKGEIVAGKDGGQRYSS